MDLGGDMPVTIVIKAPNQRMADQTVDCMLGWTIRKLKQHLESVYPSKPKHNEQKLIYSGRLLQDHLTLKEILRQYEGVENPNRHTVHLVCTGTSNAEASTSQFQSQPKSSSSQSLSENQRNEPSAHEMPPDGVRRRPGRGQDPAVTSHGTTTSLSGDRQPSYGYTTAVFPSYPVTTVTPYSFQPSSPEQYAWMMQQQAYSQYMAQYIQYYQSMYYQGQPFNPQMMASSPYFQQYMNGTAAFPFMQQPPSQQQQQQQGGGAPNNAPPAQGGAGDRVEAAQRPNNVRMNAQGGLDDDDDDENEPRDWLHHVYFLMRFLTFMGILFFYSTITRFLVVFIGSLAIFLLQKARKHIQRLQREQQRRREEQQQREQENAPGEQQPGAPGGAGNVETPQVIPQSQEENPDGQRNETPSEQQQEAEGEGQVPAAQEVPAPEEGRSFLGTFLFLINTIQTFFTSLLPTPPELLDAN